MNAMTALEKFQNLPEANKVPEIVFKLDAIDREIAELMEIRKQVEQRLISELRNNWSGEEINAAGFLHE